MNKHILHPLFLQLTVHLCHLDALDSYGGFGGKEGQHRRDTIADRKPDYWANRSHLKGTVRRDE
jgi:hypothetical protein